VTRCIVSAVANLLAGDVVELRQQQLPNVSGDATLRLDSASIVLQRIG